MAMKWAGMTDCDASESIQSANRFVSGALRRIRIRAKVKKLNWMEGMVAMPQPALAHEMEELFPSRD
jgi:hypothetical protein